MFGKKNATLTEQDVLAALKGVQDPDLHRDLVDLGMIKDIKIGAGSLALTVNLTTPACPLKAQIEREVRAALSSRLGEDLAVTVNMTAEVRGKGIVEKGDIPHVKNVLAVGSGKGGVGKSTLAAAIAYGLQSYGASVGLMDADVYGPSIPHLVGARGRPAALGDRIQPIEAAGLKLMSIGFLIEPEKAVIMRGPMLHGIVQQFLHQVDWGALDYLIIDLPPGTGDVPLTLSQSLPLTGAVVVCTPQQVALLDAVRAVAMFRQLKVPILGMVENMSGEIFGRGGVRKKAEQLGVPFLGEVPLNVAIRELGDEGQMRALLDPDSSARGPLLGVVEQLAQQISIQNIKTPKFPKLEILN
ncbi:MAG TPA: Mrp/NBP35 family ATP-binding protein [Isosphaeraceae bacterium]|jgi:ATP-binding protein involved in chromosome partitioning|nr:Mrp/NBP35 family ATP-binding protein [Isosphaeraceae bacterium]